MAYGRKKFREGERQGELKDIASKTAMKGITPVEVMLSAMREYHEEAEDAFELAQDEALPEKRRKELKSYGRMMMDSACDRAKEAAPYVHARLTATTLSSDPEAPLFIAAAEDLKLLVRGKGK